MHPTRSLLDFDAQSREEEHTPVMDMPWCSGERKKSSDIAAPVDPGVMKTFSGVSDKEILGHRHLLTSIHMPSKNQHRHGHSQAPRSRHHLRSRRNIKHRARAGDTITEDERPITPPAKRVQFILGEDAMNGHTPHPVFSEMEELVSDDKGQTEWKETARWIKFEEDVEEGGNRWSKPHVGTLSLHSLFELRSILLNGTICLDMEASNLSEIIELVLDNMVNSGLVLNELRSTIKQTILKRHRHQYEGTSDSSSTNISKLQMIRSLADIGRITSSSKSTGAISANGEKEPLKKESDNHLEVADASDNIQKKLNNHFMKKIPKGAEASNILVGELNILEKPISAFIRLNTAQILGNLTEVPVPTRFIFILLGPTDDEGINVMRYHEIGRSVATLLSDEIFHDVAYKAKNREHLVAGIDEFLDAVTILPPGEWDPSIRIEPPEAVPSQDGRKHPNQPKQVVDEEVEELKEMQNSGLTRSGKLFGGLINDINHKKPFYYSDFKDAFALQCIASTIFIYFATLTPIITFGGLLGDATENRIAPLEALLAATIVGVSYGFFAGQPLTILGLTGPVLVFEDILYSTCKSFGWDYLSFRLCIGIWVGLILLIFVATDASAFVCFITRFTEENFATLIAVIFIKKAFDKLVHIKDDYPIHPSPCFCQANNDSSEIFNTNNMTEDDKYICNFTKSSNESFIIEGFQSIGCHYEPNSYLMSVLLFIGTFLISFYLKNFKTANFFPNMVRVMISDFSVIIAIVSMTLCDYITAVNTPKLIVPATFSPTWEGRGWLIHPLGNNPWWTIILAIIPAMLATILIFMDQQITAVIVNRKEHKLKKGGGYHLDLFIVMLMIMICSIFGLPWLVAATVLSINHVRSLTRESETAAPGEKPKFLGIREQRVTTILVFLLIGLSVLMTPMLKIIPMPVLYGVFLYMGVASLNGLQFYERLLLFFMPKKYQPDYTYLRKVPLYRIHFFTLIQLSCFVLLWVIKDVKQTSILFPLMLIVIMMVRKAIDCVFSIDELKALDDILPDFKSKKHNVHANEENALNANKNQENKEDNLAVELNNGNFMKLKLHHEKSDINISEELKKSSIWKSVEGLGASRTNNGGGNKSKNTSAAPVLSMVVEHADEDAGLTMIVPTSAQTNCPKDHV